MKKKFDLRSFISLSLFLAFFAMFFTGIVLYLKPVGKVARAIGWKLIGLTKENWEAVHTTFSYLFVILTIIHIFTINRKIIWAYIKSKAKSGVNRKKELLVSVLLFAVVLAGTINDISPFKDVMVFGDYLTNIWEKDVKTEPSLKTENIPDSNKLHNDTLINVDGVFENQTPQFTKTEIDKSLEKIAVEHEKDVDIVIESLKNEGIVADKKEVLKDVADKAGTSPEQVFRIITE